MQQHRISVLAVLAIAVALAGCLGQAPATEPSPTNASPSAPSGTATAEGGTATTAATATLVPFALHMTADRALQLEPPAEGTLTLDTPVNGPETPGYPSWTGALPGDVAWGEEGLPISFFVTTNSFTVRANNVPVFADLPGFFVALHVGSRTLGAELDGPPAMIAGDIHEVAGALMGPAGSAAAGEDVVLEIEVIYSHVTTVAEFQYLMGPDQPAHVGFNGSP
ncbi:MAG TPA: hypothetical protein VGR28_01190 [Candidatus Thermoplasmatota archaeon]|jgi:hypothetical protein|nr:hypothetical protein [Candidatus Thermoplasmatota archaeon]